MGHWGFVLAAYTLVFGLLLTYWWRVESAIRALERGGESHPAATRP